MAGNAQYLVQVLQRAMDHFQANRLHDAEGALRQVLAAEPANVAALDLLGCVAQQTGRPEQALAFLRRALHIAPYDGFVHFNLGTTLAEQGDCEGALGWFRRVLVLNPTHDRAQAKCAELLHRLGCYDEAVAWYRRVLNASPVNAVIHNKLGNALQHLGRWSEAENHYRLALQHHSDYPAAFNNLGVVLQRLDQIDEAQRCYHRALALVPGYGDAHNNLGNLLQERLAMGEAIHHYREAARYGACTRWNLATALLLCGDYAEGLACYEQRFEGAEEAAQARLTLARLAALPRWQGEDLAGRPLLVWAEQGLGDTLMMLRYLPLLVGRGVGRIIAAVPAALQRLVGSMPAVSEVIGLEAPLPEDVACHCPIMSLPYLFGTRLQTIPPAPYLRVVPALALRWHERFARYPGLKVGLVWAGSPGQRKDARRSIPFELLAPLLAIPVQFVSLQKAASPSDRRVLDWMAECQDLLDTAALTEALDLVITVDTAVAHLAGALAKPVWLFNRYESEWRWMLEREDSPWYGTLRIFRQPAPRDWASVIARMAAVLRQRVVDDTSG